MSTAVPVPIVTAREPRGRSRLVPFALFILVALTLCALFGEAIAPKDPNALDPTAILKSPSLVYPFGTDINGRDQLSRVIVASRVDLGIAVTSAAIAFLAGGLVGLFAGYRGGWAAELTARVSDILLAFPVFVLAMALVAFRGPSATNVVIVVTFLNAPIFARLMRTQTASLKTRRFVEAARGLGLSNTTIVRRHVLPNALPPALAQLSVAIGWAMLLTAGLSFVGAGVRPPTAEWGAMISQGAPQMITGQWWVALFPGIAITLTVFSVAIIGDTVDEWLSPRRRRVQ